MKFNDPEVLDNAEDDWGHRRANMRHEVAVPGRLTEALGIEVDCVIEDVSKSGMLLAIEPVPTEPNREPLKTGSNATLEFTPDPVNDPANKVTTQVRIMWRAPVALGVAFNEDTPALREALATIARAAVEARVEQGQSTGLTAAQRAVLKECRKTVQKLLPNIVWSMRTDLANRIRTAADEAGDDNRRAMEAEANLIDEKAMAITRTIEHQFLQGFAAVSDLEQTQEMTLMQLRTTEKSKDAALAEAALELQGAADHNAHIAAVAQALEEQYRSQFFELNVRLANVLGHQLDAARNPLVPSNACRIIWQAVVNYSDSQLVQKHLRYTLLQRVMPLLGELYDGINKTLDENGAQRIFDVRKQQKSAHPK